jgi:hypothetical protein
MSLLFDALQVLAEGREHRLPIVHRYKYSAVLQTYRLSDVAVSTRAGRISVSDIRDSTDIGGFQYYP